MATKQDAGARQAQLALEVLPLYRLQLKHARHFHGLPRHGDAVEMHHARYAFPDRTASITRNKPHKVLANAYSSSADKEGPGSPFPHRTAKIKPPLTSQRKNQPPFSPEPNGNDRVRPPQVSASLNSAQNVSRSLTQRSTEAQSSYQILRFDELRPLAMARPVAEATKYVRDLRIRKAVQIQPVGVS